MVSTDTVLGQEIITRGDESLGSLLGLFYHLSG